MRSISSRPSLPGLSRRGSRVGLRRRVRRSRPGRWMLDRHRQVLTRRELRRQPDRFDDVQTCCLFLGHVKSGGTLLGAMLDAHPSTAIADEMDVVAQVGAGLDREQIFTLLVRGARREAENGRVTARRLDPYSLAVPGQWQGRHERLRVIGDSRAGPTTRALGDAPERLTALRSVMGDTRLVFVQVIRNPYEPIGAMVRRSGRSVEDATADHEAQCRRLVSLRERLPAEDVHTVRYEELVADPRRSLLALLGFLGLEPSPDHLDACTGLVRPVPVRERDRVPWTPSQIDTIEGLIARFGFLAGYGYDT
jgi:hypothetical protein